VSLEAGARREQKKTYFVLCTSKETSHHETETRQTKTKRLD
jgi:hypothetical protein